MENAVYIFAWGKEHRVWKIAAVMRYPATKLSHSVSELNKL